MKNIDFLIFEKDIINAILRANDNTQILMKQYAVACVKQRIYTGVGFYTDYEVMDDSSREDTRGRFCCVDKVLKM